MGKALRRRTDLEGLFPISFSRGEQHAKKTVSRTVLAAPKSKAVTLELDRPLLIYSRYDLNGLLLERAQRAGAQIEKTRVLDHGAQGCPLVAAHQERRDGGRLLRPRHGRAQSAPRVRNRIERPTTMSALGYYVAGEREDIDIQFLAGLEGYIWVFPRCGHLSVGICGKGEPASALRVRLEAYMEEQGLSKAGATFYSHLLPSLETRAWKRNRVAGDGWLAVGDAAGLVDPITGEGLYYAIRSADLAAKAILSDTAQPSSAYRKSIRRDFVADLEFGSRLAGRVFTGPFC